MYDGEEGDVAWLHRGWRWLEDHPDHPQHAALEQAWCVRLRKYEETYRYVYLSKETEDERRGAAQV